MQRPFLVNVLAELSRDDIFAEDLQHSAFGIEAVELHVVNRKITAKGDCNNVAIAEAGINADADRGRRCLCAMLVTYLALERDSS